MTPHTDAGPGSRRPWILAAGLLVAVVAGVALHVAEIAAGAGPRFGEWSASTINTISFGVVAVLLLRRRVAPRIAALLAAIAAGSGLQLVAGEYAMYGRYAAHDRWPGTAVAALLCMLFVVSAYALLPPLLASFPDGRALSRRWRWLGYLYAAAMALTLLAATFAPGPLNNNTPGFSNPWGLPRQTALAKLSVAMPPLLYVLFGIAGALVSLVLRWRRADPLTRLQIKWVVLGALAGGGALLTAPWLQHLLPRLPGDVLGWVTWTVGAALVPVTIGISVLRYRLYDVDRLLSRTVSYTLLTGLLALCYVAMVTGIGRLLPARSSSLVVAAATLCVAALFRPLRRRVQHGVDRRFNRARVDAERLGDAFGRRLRLEFDADAVRDDLLQVACRAVAPAHASLWVRRAGWSVPTVRVAGGQQPTQ